MKRSYWDKYKKSDFQDKNDKLVKKIKQIFDVNKKQYGYRKIKYELNLLGINVNHKKIARLMKINGIIAQFIRRMRSTKKIKIGLKISKNKYPDLIQHKYSLIKERFTTLYIDVTFHVLNGKRFYQSTIIDGATKEIVDYKISNFNDQKLALDNLYGAVNNISKIKDPSGIIIHSDHGSQYTSNVWKNVCESLNLFISMWKTYTCADNVLIESFHSLLKKGTIYNNNYSSIEEYINNIINWNNWYDNKKLQITHDL